MSEKLRQTLLILGVPGVPGGAGRQPKIKGRPAVYVKSGVGKLDDWGNR